MTRSISGEKFIQGAAGPRFEASGCLVISLDFELYWGVRDNRRLDSYRENLEGVWNAIPCLLALFSSFGIRATWATVGLLMCENEDEALAYAPSLRPRYRNRSLSPYPYLTAIPATAKHLHFAPNLVRQILASPGQELASHTFSHFYCSEKGQDIEAFRADLTAAARVSLDKFGVRPTSLVFPRNQCNPNYLRACQESGMRAYRGNATGWMFGARPESEERVWRRGLRLLDHYAPLSGHNVACVWLDSNDGMVNIPASRFLRPFSPRLARFDTWRRSRILEGMETAAKERRTYHLWFHPHNFGRDLEANRRFLVSILEQYRLLHDRHGMRSLNMADVADEVDVRSRAVPE